VPNKEVSGSKRLGRFTLAEKLARMVLEDKMQNELWDMLKNDPMMLREFVEIHMKMTLWQRFTYRIALKWSKFKKRA